MTAARSERLTRLMRIATAVAFAVAGGALLWRPSLEAELPEEAAGTLAADSAFAFAPASAARAGDAQRIVANNLFASSRRPPARRYAQGTSSPAGADAISADPGMTLDPSGSSDTPTLMGTVIDALGARALILAPAIDSVPRFYRAGERVGAYRVRRVDPGRVLLDGPTGRVVLDLLKPNEARP